MTYDLGLFGPESVTWRLHAEPALWVGGIRALFLQALHPEAMAKLDRYSVFKDDPWGRLRRTAEYVGTTTYGTRAQAEAAGARVRLVHQRLGLDDPHLLLWVHCCEVDSFLTASTRSGVRLSAADADRFVAEQVRSARLVGLSSAPRTTAELSAYFDGIRPELGAIPAARAAARFMLWPPMSVKAQLLTPARPAWVALAGLSFSLLPSWARRLYATPGLPTTDWGATLGMRSVRALTRLVPPAYREGPHLKDARERLAATPVRRLEALT